jgi:hypothetical protein
MKNADVLDRMIAGESVEASPEVRELAQLAALLQGAWQQAPTPASTVRTRDAVLSAFQENGNGNGAATMPLRMVRPTRGRRIALRLALAAALVIGLPVTAFAASADALPGQLIYPVKRGFEEMRLALAGNPVAEGEVLLDFAGERVEEAVIARTLGEREAAAGALEGYEEAVARFDGRILEAQELGLPVEALTARAEGLFSTYGQLLETLFGPPPTATVSEEVPEVPVEVSAAGGAADEAPKANKGGGGNKGKGQDNRGGNNRSQNSGGGGGQGDGKGDNGGGGNGGNAGAGGGGGGSGGGGTTEEASGGGNCGNGNGQGGAANSGQGTGSGNTCGDGTSGGDDDGEDGKKDDKPEPEDDEDDDEGDDEGSEDGDD